LIRPDSALPLPIHYYPPDLPITARRDDLVRSETASLRPHSNLDLP
jgi:hypothetical protein